MPAIDHSTLLIGVAASGVTHSDKAIPDIRTKVQMAKNACVFDYINRSPPDEEFRELLNASVEYGMPVLASTWFYTLGRDEQTFERNILKGRLLGNLVHDVQLTTHHADGHPLSDDEVANAYSRFHEFGARHDVAVCFEIHVNMWSEHFGRVTTVADLVRRRGIPFNLTLDHSHVIFKIDNPDEQLVQGMNADIASGRLILEPEKSDNIIQQWIEAGYVRHCHARSAAPRNPRNIWAKHPDGSFGRGIQYPFIEPAAGEWHHPWSESDLTSWKLVVRKLLTWHAQHPDSRLRTITCEFIPAVDYGAGAGYSVFDQNVACARWLRDEWRETRQAFAARQRKTAGSETITGSSTHETG